MSATDELRRLLDGLRNVGNLHEFAELFGFNWYDESDWTWNDVAVKMADDLEHAIAATLGADECAKCAEDMGAYADSLCDSIKERLDELLRCLENDWNISASWDGLRKFWNIGLTEEGVRLRDAELNSRAERTCHDEGDPSDFCCSECGTRMFTDVNDTYTMIANDEQTIIKHPNYCPNCGARVVDGKEGE